MIRGISVRVRCKRMRKERASLVERTGSARAKGILVRWGLLRLPERQKSMVRGLLESF
jgi:hypothetical protein